MSRRVGRPIVRFIHYPHCSPSFCSANFPQWRSVLAGPHPRSRASRALLGSRRRSTLGVPLVSQACHAGHEARTSAASEPRERSGARAPASERVGESEGRSPSVKRSAPGRTRTCDPRLRRVHACVGGASFQQVARAATRTCHAVDLSRIAANDEPNRILLDAGLYSSASKRQPSGGSIGAIIRPCIEGNRRAWGSLTNSVDDGFE